MSDMSDTAIAHTRRRLVRSILTKEFGAKLPDGCKISLPVFGSFISLRIEDPQGVVTCKLAHSISLRAMELLIAQQILSEKTPRVVPAYHMDGIVTTWSWGDR